jgi:hypothetical protein
METPDSQGLPVLRTAIFALGNAVDGNFFGWQRVRSKKISREIAAQFGFARTNPEVKDVQKNA